jgi:hypothetical protein
VDLVAIAVHPAVFTAAAMARVQKSEQEDDVVGLPKTAHLFEVMPIKIIRNLFLSVALYESWLGLHVI